MDYASGASRTHFGYNKSGHMQTVAFGPMGQATTANFGYGLSLSGRRNSLNETIQTLNTVSARSLAYGYDAHNRLLTETLNPGGQISYEQSLQTPATTGYDAVGNRRSRVSNVNGVPEVTGLQHDPNDRLTGPSATADYSYDANGNTIGVNLSNGTTADDIRDEYDYENRLIRRKIGPLATPTKVIQFAYDADGNRVRKSVTEGGTTTTMLFLIDDQNPTGYAQVIEELPAYPGDPTKRYVYGHRLVRQEIYNPAFSWWDVYYYGYDGHGSVRFLSDYNGTILDTYTYDAFGILIAQTGPATPNNMLYAGEY
jgi:YD repeat-containing protein